MTAFADGSRHIFIETDSGVMVPIGVISVSNEVTLYGIARVKIDSTDYSRAVEVVSKIVRSKPVGRPATPVIDKRKPRTLTGEVENKEITRGRRPKATKMRLRLLKMAGDVPTCYWCKRVMTPESAPNADRFPTVDHVKRLADGGAHHRSNCVLACRKCNNGRHREGWMPGK